MKTPPSKASNGFCNRQSPDPLKWVSSKDPPHSESVHIPLVPSANPADVARSILGAAVAGNITPDTAVQLLSAAAGLSRIIETEELKARLEALERCVAPPKLSQKKRP